MCRKGNPFALLVGMQIGAATVESCMAIPQKIKNGSAFLIYLFLERNGGRKRGREASVCGYLLRGPH